MDQPPKVLLVEGPDDEHVVRHLLKRASSPASFCILNKGGVGELLKAISLEIKASDRMAVGILVDANNNLADRWRAVSDRLLRGAGIEAPDIPSPGGTVIDTIPRIGIWLIPDNRRPGELEDFVQEMIPQDDPAWPLAREYVRGIPEEARKFRANKTSRAELHAWLATREEPGFMGSAIRRGDLETDGPLCTEFVEWLDRLFA